MAKLRSMKTQAKFVQDVLDDLMKKSAEFGIKDLEKDLVSISVLRPTQEFRIENDKAVAGYDIAEVEVFVVFWDHSEAKLPAPKDPLSQLKVEYLYLYMDEARSKARAAGHTIRVVKQNGKDLIGTDDYFENRINVAVVDGEIMGIIGIG